MEHGTMASEKLSKTKIEDAVKGKIKTAGGVVRRMHCDGKGLYLHADGSGAASWVFCYVRDGRSHDMGLGAFPDVSVETAREKARAARLLIRDADIDPLEHRKQERDARREAAPKRITFAEATKRYVAANRADWTNPRHAREWVASLERHAFPVLGNMLVNTIETPHVMRVLEPLWVGDDAIPETAARVRGRIESVLGWAEMAEFRPGPNPARWGAHLENLLPAPTKAKRATRERTGAAEHLPALPYAEVPAFMAELRQQEGVAASCLEFIVLTAVREGEAFGARWDEFDMAARLWVVPGARTKSREEHRVPLSDAVMAIVEQMAAIREGEFLFAGGRHGRPISAPSVRRALYQLRTSPTIHGFRSSFIDWAVERTNFPPEMRELALGHKVGSAVERAYRRTDLVEKRRKMADAWARFAAGETVEGAVVPLRATGR
jgi:integrase